MALQPEAGQRVRLENEEATLLFAAELAVAVDHLLSGPDAPRSRALMIYLSGDLGAGKTTLSRGLLRALGHAGSVKSPTYTLVEPYENLKFPVYHFDLYRLSDPEEVEFLGVESYFGSDGLCLVEWAENGRPLLPPADLLLQLTTDGRGRELYWQAGSVAGERLAEDLSDRLAINRQ